MELLVDIVTSNTKFVVLGNFNIHVNDIDDANASIFLDTMTALGLKQHIEGPTHKSGNCVNLIFTEEMSRVKAIGCSQITTPFNVYLTSQRRIVLKKK